MATAGTEEVVLDSLPYIEQIHNDYEEYALALIEEEMKNGNSNNMNPLEPIKFRSNLMKKEYKTLIKNGGNGDGDDDAEMAVPRSPQDGGGSSFFVPPKIARPAPTPSSKSIEGWTTHAIPAAKQRYESERIRSMVLEAQKEDAVTDWKMYNSKLERGVKSMYESSLKTTSENIEEINYQRQKIQTDSFLPQLDELTVQHQQIVYRRNQLEHTIEGLRRQQQQQL
mmetsp:Transcript_18177/g.43940  ORF Transcript_18177/g.43940 Transcript_18177/m.43940 type:complete len:225 (+) Transcript_18177:107-781(+)